MLLSLSLSVMCAALAFPPPLPGSNQPANQAREFQGFPVLPPIPTADPSIRTEKAFRLPARLQVKRTDQQMSFSFEDVGPIKVKVGKHMVTGLKQELRVYRAGKVVLSGYSSLESGPGDASSIGVILNRSVDKIPQRGEKYSIEVQLTLFETDIPPQHLWSPESGKYRVLWSRTLTEKAE
jgi:hypothetical protein